MNKKQREDLRRAVLRAFAGREHKELLTGEIGACCPEEFQRIRHFVANRLGPFLAAMAKEGILLRRPNPYPNWEGTASFWRLGPVADKLRDEGWF